MHLIGILTPIDGSMSLVSASAENGHTNSPLLAVMGLLGILAIVAIAAYSQVGAMPQRKFPRKSSSRQPRVPRVGQAVFNRKVG